jgi:hypothetical protein
MSVCDMPEFCDVRTVKARKQHQCCECRTPIAIGEQHYAIAGKWDGDLMTFRQHLECCQACRFIRDEMNAGEPWEERCVGFGELFDWIADAWQGKRQFPSEFRSLLATIRRRQLAVRRAKRDSVV